MKTGSPQSTNCIVFIYEQGFLSQWSRSVSEKLDGCEQLSPALQKRDEFDRGDVADEEPGLDVLQLGVVTYIDLPP